MKLKAFQHFNQPVLVNERSIGTNVYGQVVAMGFAIDLDDEFGFLVIHPTEGGELRWVPVDRIAWPPVLMTQIVAEASGAVRDGEPVKLNRAARRAGN